MGFLNVLALLYTAVTRRLIAEDWPLTPMALFPWNGCQWRLLHSVFVEGSSVQGDSIFLHFFPGAKSVHGDSIFLRLLLRPSRSKWTSFSCSVFWGQAGPRVIGVHPPWSRRECFERKRG